MLRQEIRVNEIQVKAVCGPPDKIPVSKTWGHLHRMGRLSSGRQFLLVPLHHRAPEGEGDVRSFICHFEFLMDGKLAASDIQGFDKDRHVGIGIELNTRFHRLPIEEECDIAIAAFAVEHDGITFGMIPIAPDPDDPDDVWYVVLQPGADAIFSPPWDGTYETS